MAWTSRDVTSKRSSQSYEIHRGTSFSAWSMVAADLVLVMIQNPPTLQQLPDVRNLQHWVRLTCEAGGVSKKASDMACTERQGSDPPRSVTGADNS